MRSAEWLVARPWRLVLLVLLAVLPLLLVGELAAADTTARHQAAAADTARRAATSAAASFADRVSAISLAVGNAAMRTSTGKTTPLIDALDRNDESAAQIELEEMHRFIDPAATWLLVLDPRSRLIAVDPFATGLAGTDLSGRITPSRGSAAIEVGDAFAWNDDLTRDPSGTGPAGGGSRGNPAATSVAISVSAPIGTTQPLGFRLVVVVRLSALAGHSTSQLRTAYQDAYFVDRGGHLALRASRAFTPDDLAYRDLSGSPAVASLASGVADPLAPERVVRGVARVPEIGWSVLIVDAPTALDSDLEASLGQQRALRIGLAGALLLGAALVGSASSTAIRRRRETAEALERQTALAEILRVIASSPSNQQPVLDAIAANATRYCGATDAVVHLVHGDKIVRAAHHGPIPTATDPSVPIERTLVVGRAIVDGRTIHVADITGPAGEAFPLARQRAAEVGNRGILATPLLHAGTPIGVILLRRMDPNGFTPSQIQLVEAFANQAVIAIENVRLFNETKESLDQQTALSDVLRTISRSAFDLDAVLQTIVERAAALVGAEAAAITRRDGDEAVVLAQFGPMLPASQRPGTRIPVVQRTAIGRALLTGKRQYIADAAEDPDLAQSGPRTRLVIPFLRDGTAIGTLGVTHNLPKPIGDREVKMLETFADQAAIAIENVRLFNETKEALERQTATSEVLKTISRAPFELQPILDTLVQNAARLSLADNAHLVSFVGGVLRDVAHVGETSEEYDRIVADRMNGRAFVTGRGTVDGRVILERRPVQIVDVLEDPEYEWHEAQRAGGFRTVLGVPLMRQDQPIGVIVVSRRRVDAFTDKQIELLATFADQAVIAMENVRLFNETKEALEQQTAVAEVLKTISRSAFDLQPVLDIVLNNAVRLAGADIGWLSRVENEQFMTVAYSAEFPESVREELVRQRAQGHLAGPWVPLGTGGGLMGFTLAEGRTVHLPDLKADPDLKGSVVARLTASRTVVGVPMLREGRTIGGMVLARYEVRPFGEREIELVQTFTDQAAIAIENVRLFNDTKESLERQSAVSEVLKTISRTVFELAPTLQTVVENAARLCDADVAWMTRRMGDKQGEIFSDNTRFGARWARTAELLNRFNTDVNATPPTDPRSIMGRTYLERRTITLDDVTTEKDLDRSSTAMAVGARSVLAVPVLRDTETLGVMILARTVIRPFSARDVELVETFADQAAIAIQNVRLFSEIQDKSQQLEVASRHKSEFLANMSHELRTPLNAIIGFSEVLMQGLFGDVNEKQREYLQDVVGSGQHLLSLINDILDLSKIEAGRMELELSSFSFGDALASGVTIVRERASRHNITISVVSDELGQVEADERKLKQILYNLLSNAVKFTPDGGRVDVSVRRDNGDVRVEVRDNGIGIAEDDQARIFEEFQQVGRERAREGTGLGLTLTKRFVELHGGRIWLESAPGKGSTFAFTLPLRQAAVVRA